MRATGRPVLAAALGLLILLGSPAVGAAAPRRQHVPAQALDDAPTLHLIRQTGVTDPEGSFAVDLRVVGAPPGATVAARLYEPVQDRSDLDPILFGQRLGEGRKTLTPVEVAASTPATGGGRAVSLRLALCSEGPCGDDRTRLRTDGVYPFDIRLLDEDGDQLTRLITFMVRRPDDPDRVTPLLTALTLDLHARPSIGPDAAPAWGPADLAGVRAVTQALVAHPDVALTIAPTPETIEAVAAADPELAQRLRIALQGDTRQVVAGTYVDLPVAAWVAAGLGDELVQQRVRGTNALEALLPEPDIRTWLADPTLTEAAAVRLQETGVGQVVVDPEGLAPVDAGDPDDPDDYPLTRPFELDTGTTEELRAVAVDPRLRSRLGATADPVLAAHRVLAELAVLAYEAPTEGRGVVVAPPVGWVATPEVLEPLLTGLEQATGLLQTATVTDLFTTVPAEAAGGGPADGEPVLRRRLAPAPSPSLGRYPSDLVTARRLLDSYRSMIGESNRRVDPLDDRLLVSGAVDLSASERDRHVAAVTAAVSRELGGVEVPERQTVTLTSAEGQLPLTIRNRLDYPVTVTVELAASQRVEFPDGPTTQLDLQPRETKNLNIDVRARASGDTPIDVVVRTPDARVLTTTRYQVRSTAVSGVGILLTGGAAAFLAYWWVRHVRRTRRQRRLLVDPAGIDPASARTGTSGRPEPVASADGAPADGAPATVPPGRG